MKRFERFAIVLMVLWILTLIPNPVITIILERISTPQEFGQLTMIQVLLNSVRAILAVLVHIAIGVWLFVQAKRDKLSPWVWCLFGCLFGITVIVLYYVMQLVEEMKLKRKSGEPR